MPITQYIEGNNDEPESKRYNQVFVLPVYCMEHCS